MLRCPLPFVITHRASIGINKGLVSSLIIFIIYLLYCIRRIYLIYFFFVYFILKVCDKISWAEHQALNNTQKMSAEEKSSHWLNFVLLLTLCACTKDPWNQWCIWYGPVVSEQSDILWSAHKSILDVQSRVYYIWSNVHNVHQGCRSCSCMGSRGWLGVRSEVRS